MKKIIISLLFSLLPGLVYAEDVSVEPASIEPVGASRLKRNKM